MICIISEMGMSKEAFKLLGREMVTDDIILIPVKSWSKLGDQWGPLKEPKVT